MALSAEEELIIRTWVGDDPTTAYLEDLYAALGSWDAVVVHTLRRKIALLSEEPTSLSVPGLSITYNQQIQALQQTLKDFENAGGTGLDGEVSNGGIEVARLVRVDNVR